MIYLSVNFYKFQTNIRKFSVTFGGKNVLNSFSNEIQKADSVELFKKNLRCSLHL